MCFPQLLYASTNVYAYVIIHLCHRTVRIYEIYNIDMYIYMIIDACIFIQLYIFYNYAYNIYIIIYMYCIYIYIK